MDLRVKRVYDPPSPEDGVRVLVDRLWPRGLSKERAKVDWWAKELAPSDELRRFFAHDPEKYPEFLRRYREELEGNPTLERLRALAQRGRVTFLFGAREARYNNATALAEILRENPEEAV
ncbi:DUF488 domain-containing protein [Thermus thermamylovorans]|uniref:DUF488 family protein n=1 Tax=Thermus thermamylovorans TaxID=2509362 RepID=A0A4Q9B4M2_9DEIN|nr:DUF488 family protein [Thermus thermamylovorans]TBH20063.1 DUF488 family protein [Thermus thermamylovorans]